MRDSCYRFRAVAEPSDNQTYGAFDEVPLDDGECTMFWPIEQAEGPLSNGIN